MTQIGLIDVVPLLKATRPLKLTLQHGHRYWCAAVPGRHRTGNYKKRADSELVYKVRLHTDLPLAAWPRWCAASLPRRQAATEP